MILERVPTLIGTKLPKGEPLWFANVCEKVPEIAHFTGEYTFAADFAGGASRLCSWLAVTNPRLALEWYDALVRGDYNAALRIQALVNRYKIQVKSTWRGQSDAAVNKADAAVNPNMRCDVRVRPPYASCTRDDVARKRARKQSNNGRYCENKRPCPRLVFAKTVVRARVNLSRSAHTKRALAGISRSSTALSAPWCYPVRAPLHGLHGEKASDRNDCHGSPVGF